MPVLRWRTWICTPALDPDSCFLPAQTPGGTSDAWSSWVPATHRGDLDCVPALSFSLGHSGHLGTGAANGSSLSASQIKKKKKKVYIIPCYVQNWCCLCFNNLSWKFSSRMVIISQDAVARLPGFHSDLSLTSCVALGKSLHLLF